MAKGYWIAFYRSVSDEAALKTHAGMATAYSSAPWWWSSTSVAAAIRTYESAEYQKALAVIQGKVDRDLRIVEGT